VYCTIFFQQKFQSECSPVNNQKRSAIYHVFHSSARPFFFDDAIVSARPSYKAAILLVIERYACSQPAFLLQAGAEN
jgi:hypothetical protein